MKINIDFKLLQKIKSYNKRQMSTFLCSVYESGVKDGYEKYKMEKGNTIDFDLLKIAIRATDGIGDVLYKRIVETIDNLCFKEDINNE